MASSTASATSGHSSTTFVQVLSSHFMLSGCIFHISQCQGSVQLRISCTLDRMFGQLWRRKGMVPVPDVPQIVLDYIAHRALAAPGRRPGTGRTGDVLSLVTCGKAARSRKSVISHGNRPHLPKATGKVCARGGWEHGPDTPQPRLRLTMYL